jgi:long-chain acyl-CoA synthetase
MIVFKKIRHLTGGSLRGPISGGGALPEYVDNFYMAIKMEILEGWGLTETAPVNGVRTFETKVPRTVGPLAPGVKIMIGDEFGKPLANQSDKGIVYLKGDNIMAGYYKEPKKTKEVFTKDGWFNTGDLGRMTLSGSLQLCGRHKDTIVLLGGENIEPEPIENKLLECPAIYQVMVVGQDKKVLGALIVPAFDNLESFAKKHDINYKSIEDLCRNNLVIEEVKKEIKSKVNERHGFRDYERITFFTLITRPFEPGVEMTHSLKMKRDVIAEKYKKIIDKMFI